ncbi:MAG: hypothetical protein ACOYU3_00705 [Bacillota bacterium]
MKKRHLPVIIIIALTLAGCGAPAATPSPTASPAPAATASPSPTPAASPTAVITSESTKTVAQPDRITLTDKKGKKVTVFLGMSSTTAGNLIENADFGKYNDTGDAGSETIANNTFRLTFMPHAEGSEYTLSSIGFTGKDYATVAGLRVGDTKARMEKLYGTHYKAYNPADYALEPTTGKGLGMCYEYAMGDHYLDIVIRDGTVVRWSVERYHYDEFSRRLIPPGMPNSYWN